MIFTHMMLGILIIILIVLIMSDFYNVNRWKRIMKKVRNVDFSALDMQTTQMFDTYCTDTMEYIKQNLRLADYRLLEISPRCRVYLLSPSDSQNAIIINYDKTLHNDNLPLSSDKEVVTFVSKTVPCVLLVKIKDLNLITLDEQTPLRAILTEADICHF